MNTDETNPPGRDAGRDRTAYSMHALGRDGLPARFDLDGVTWRLVQEVKHDFFAATGFYEDAAGRRAVLKMSRTVRFAGLPLRWLGRRLCRREMRFYDKLADLPNVPRVLGTVGDTGFVHDYVPARPLSKDRPVPDGFFGQLQALLDELHRRRIAYVDTNKPENILLGDDGRPHLIDFQISLDLDGLGNWPGGRWLLRRFQHEDRYHTLKHKKRLRPDELTPEESAQAEKRSALIRLHRLITKPYRWVRRPMLKKLRDSGRLLPEGSK